VVRDYYAELPISIKVSGRFHDMGSFAADIANLSRIVTLHNMNIVGVRTDPSGNLSMEAVARTYRYLDQAEIEQVRQSQQAAQGGKK
jgi:type IV pilus assembly protein PilO